ncbi:DNA polymerase [Aphelenchoides avenae]|nr:DNA polymerase [Aphelenchus avenae]
MHQEHLQPYNAHIPYLLQFFIDYSIFGMGFVCLRNAYYRKDDRNPAAIRSELGSVSNTAVEFDVISDDILNPQRVGTKYENPGLEFLWNEEAERCRLRDASLNVPTEGTIGEPKFLSEQEIDLRRDFQTLVESLRQKERQPSQDAPVSSQQVFTQAITQEVSVSGVDDETDADRVQPEEASRLWEHQELQLRGFEAEDDDEGQEDMSQSAMDEDTPDAPQSTHVPAELLDASGAKIKKQTLVEPACKKPPRKPRIVTLGKQLSEESTSKAFDESATPPPVKMKKAKARPLETWHNLDSYGDVSFRTSVFVTQKATAPTSTEAAPVWSSVKSNVDHLCVMSLEVLAMPSEDRPVPEPEHDPIVGVFFAIYEDVCNRHQRSDHRGGFVCYPPIGDDEEDEEEDVVEDWPDEEADYESDEEPEPAYSNNIEYVETEADVFKQLANVIVKHDPDIVIGYDTERYSWGYLYERATFLKNSFAYDMSRIKAHKKHRQCSRPPFGRIPLQAWSLIRRENPLRSYTFSHAVFALLKQRFPEFTSEDLASMCQSKDFGTVETAYLHMLRRAELNVQLLSAIDIFVRASQLARIAGIQFTEVLSRGSQFRVESMLFRLLRKYGYVAPSVGVEQRNRMATPETLPLNMEPESAIYRDPVVVLDFQSLYPSVCIAYNYCFSTCLGKLARYREYASGSSQRPDMVLGAIGYQPLKADELDALVKEGLVHVTPTGGVFVSRTVRCGLVPTLLTEMLDTRVMVKQAMKAYKADKNLLRLLDARQLALKLIANVTYGYTAANWSGRMPCEERGRYDWSRMRQKDKYKGARVVYGDTDSLFVLFEGSSKDDAFRLGHQIAKEVTDANPFPMKLKFEKVMMPCVLITKKRYVGMSYETPEDKQGVFDAKGIETVRRDSCSFVSKIMEKVLLLLFRSNLDAALSFLRSKLATPEDFPISDFVLSGDYRVKYSENAVIPLKKIAEERAALSPRFAPVYGERLGFVIARPDVEADTTLISCVVPSEDFLRNPWMKVHYNYYVTKKLFPALAATWKKQKMATPGAGLVCARAR